MRFLNATWADMRFQLKQGFYLVYVAIVIMYLVILSFLPADIHRIALPLVVFSDPSVLGLFFIGGIIMLEKNQGLLQVFVVTPLRTSEYLLSKMVSLSIVAVLAAFAITFFSNHVHVNWLILFGSTVLTSCMFTLCGVLISAGCRNVNQYLLKTVPYMFLFVLPCFSLLGSEYAYLFTVFPAVAALRLMLGAYGVMSWYEVLGLFLYLCVFNYLLFLYTIKFFESKVIFEEG